MTIAGIEKGFIHFDNVDGIGIVVDRVTNNQIYMYANMQLRSYYRERSTPGFSIYHIYNDPPFDFPMCGLYSLSEISKFQGKLIATSIQSLEVVLKQWRCKQKYYYVYNLADLETPNFSAAKAELLKQGVVLIPRASVYAEILRAECPELAHLVADIVPDFNMEKLGKVLYGKEKNS